MTATSSSILPVVSGYHTGGVTWRKHLYESPFSTLIWRSCVRTRDRQNNFGMKFNCLLEGMMSVVHLTFLFHFLPIELAHCYLDPSFLLCLLPLESLSKLYIVPTLIPTDFPFFLFYPVLTSPAWVIPSRACFVGT